MAAMPRLKLTDGSHTDLPEGEPVGDVLPPDAIARAWTVSWSICRSSPGRRGVEAVSPADDDGLHVLRHSTAHVMAQAVCDLCPGAKYAIGPAIEDGFYYDFELREPLSPEDLARIEARMREIVAAAAVRARGARRGRRRSSASPISRTSGRSSSGRGRGGARAPSATASPCTATTGGPTCASVRTSRPPAGWARSCCHVAGAYWRGDEKRPKLQRVYGTAWATRRSSTPT